MTRRLTLLAILPWLAVGCEAPEVPQVQTPAASAPAEPAKEEPPMVAGAPGKELPETEVPVTDVPRKFLSSDPVQGRRSRREASEGTNVLGIGSTVAGGMYAKHQMIILAIDQALQLYVPQHDFEYPKTQAEFLKEVVEPALNGVPLPKLQDDHEYCYVPSQPEVGLQIRLKPGSPKSKVPAGTTPEQAIAMLGGGEQAAEPAPSAAGDQWAPEPGSEEAPAEEEPSPDIRTRAGQIGNEGNENVERALAPGGLAPAGGLDE